MVPGQKKPAPVERVFDINILIGGAAGQGIQTIGTMLCKMLFREGLYVFALQDYQSRIRGGHNTFRVRISNRPVSASTERIDILVAMNEETYRVHLPQTAREGIMIYDAEKVTPSDSLVSGGSIGLCAVPMGAIANETVKDKKLANTVALGSILGMLEIDIGRAGSHCAELFAKKGEAVVQMNTAALQAGYAYVKEHYHRKTGISLPPDERFIKKQEMIKKARNPRADGRMLINGSEAGGFGMLASGVQFYSAYPMTPSTGLLNYLAAHAQKNNIFVEQAEDEIAAVNMALGASFAGARSAVGTSGGGFALMVEAVSLAGITETPIVFYIIQRPGPATGLPTRTEQADLEFILHAGHGEFPRFVFAPGDPSEMFRISIQAFNLADTYQVPVFILGDQYLADSYCVQDMADVSKVQINRSIMLPEQNTAGYRRYQLTDNGISPRALPGQGKGLVIVDSDEHDEDGHLTEDLNIRIQQADKRMKKYESMKKEILGPARYGDVNADIRLVCWGSTLGIAREVVDRLRPQTNIEFVHFSSIWPFPRESAEKALRGASRIIGIENNATAQLCRIIRTETGIDIKEKILKYNGMHFFPDEVIKQINGDHS